MIIKWFQKVFTICLLLYNVEVFHLFGLLHQILILFVCYICMFSVLTSSWVDHRLKPQSSQTKDYKHHRTGICCFSDNGAI